MGSTAPYGQRLLARVIDDYAASQPDRTWAAVPRSADLRQGFRDITFKQFANAISRAAFWLEDRLGVSNGSFEAFAYAGDKDLRYPIIAVAAVKVGRKVLQRGNTRLIAQVLMVTGRYFCLRLSQQGKHRFICSRKRTAEPSYAPSPSRPKPIWSLKPVKGSR